MNPCKGLEEMGQNMNCCKWLFPKLTLLQMMTRANAEPVEVSQRGHPGPSVSIIAARQVTLSHPHGGLPSRIRGDAPLAL